MCYCLGYNIFYDGSSPGQGTYKKQLGDICALASLQLLAGLEAVGKPITGGRERAPRAACPIIQHVTINRLLILQEPRREIGKISVFLAKLEAKGRKWTKKD